MEPQNEPTQPSKFTSKMFKAEETSSPANNVPDRCPTCGSNDKERVQLSASKPKMKDAGVMACIDPWHTSDVATQPQEVHNAGTWIQGGFHTWWNEDATKLESLDNQEVAWRAFQRGFLCANQAPPTQPAPKFKEGDEVKFANFNGPMRDCPVETVVHNPRPGVYQTKGGCGVMRFREEAELVPHVRQKPVPEPWSPKWKVGQRLKHLYSGEFGEMYEYCASDKEIYVRLDSGLCVEGQNESFEWTMPAPPAGREWHRNDFTKEMLPPGTRPLCKGEECMVGDETLNRNGQKWVVLAWVSAPATEKHAPLRTTRPAPSPAQEEDLEWLSSDGRPKPEPAAQTEGKTAGEVFYEAAVKASGVLEMPSWGKLAAHYQRAYEAGAHAAIAFVQSFNSGGGKTAKQIAAQFAKYIGSDDPSYIAELQRELETDILAFAQSSRMEQASNGAPSVDALADIVREHLTCVYHCTRVWEAWSVGTMDQNDFQEAAHSELPTEIATAVHEVILKSIKALIDSNRSDSLKLDYLESLGITVVTVDNREDGSLSYRIEPGSELCLMETTTKLQEITKERDTLRRVLQRVFEETDPYADGAPDASPHDKLANALSSLVHPYIKGMQFYWSSPQEVQALKDELTSVKEACDSFTEQEKWIRAMFQCDQETGTQTAIKKFIEELNQAKAMVGKLEKHLAEYQDGEENLTTQLASANAEIVELRSKLESNGGEPPSVEELFKMAQDMYLPFVFADKAKEIISAVREAMLRTVEISEQTASLNADHWKSLVESAEQTIADLRRENVAFKQYQALPDFPTFTQLRKAHDAALSDLTAAREALGKMEVLAYETRPKLDPEGGGVTWMALSTQYLGELYKTRDERDHNRICVERLTKERDAARESLRKVEAGMLKDLQQSLTEKRAMVNALQDELTTLKASSGWVELSERRPTHLDARKHPNFNSAVEWSNGVETWIGRWDEPEFNERFKATHWRVFTLPTPPPSPEDGERVPLEACDVPPGSVFRYPQYDFEPEWQMAIAITGKGVDLLRGTDTLQFIGFQALRECGWLIKRPGEDWQPCSKAKEQQL